MEIAVERAPAHAKAIEPKKRLPCLEVGATTGIPRGFPGAIMGMSDQTQLMWMFQKHLLNVQRNQQFELKQKLTL